VLPSRPLQRLVFGTAELAEQKAFFDVAHAERLNKPSSFMLALCVSQKRSARRCGGKVEA